MMRCTRNTGSAALPIPGAAFLFALLLCLFVPPPAAAVETPKASAYLLMADGRVVEAASERKKLAPASLTKMMTVLIALEKSDVLAEVRIGAAAERETGHRMGLKKGDVLRVADLAAGAVIGSANDAARALAEHVAGSEAKFVKLMNARAGELGMTDTVFMNASGHDHPGHLSSARDIALLAGAAMDNPDYADLAGRVRLTVRSRAGRVFELENKNELIGRYGGAVGVKTGTTPKAGKSLAAMAKRDGHTVLLVLLGAEERWYLAEELLDRGFRATSGEEVRR